jgi:hypothetical protein
MDMALIRMSETKLREGSMAAMVYWPLSGSNNNMGYKIIPAS